MPLELDSDCDNDDFSAWKSPRRSPGGASSSGKLCLPNPKKLQKSATASTAALTPRSSSSRSRSSSPAFSQASADSWDEGYAHATSRGRTPSPCLSEAEVFHTVLVQGCPLRDFAAVVSSGNFQRLCKHDEHNLQ
ncbi:unnamed protein product [Effrenium voratum]|uniref:Uncharacterized protein n=1 Tax=Effrenium voratum TaxID=2562239 RepID=A0AA36HPH8_9DINO|nr:unnamed protein product [Effrenium voratum]CAJ1372636.1 unnamed protein product [Effrenium voratum]CAJ1416169.1 unnamed protein product [Effrenium voratum]